MRCPHCIYSNHIAMMLLLFLRTTVALTTTSCSSPNRRALFAKTIPAASLVTLTLPNPCAAVITDETERFGVGTWWTRDISPNVQSLPPSPPPSQASAATVDDEVNIYVSKQELKIRRGLGLELADIDFITNRRVYVKSIQEQSLASDLQIKKDWIITAINGQSTERTNAEGVAIILRNAVEKSNDRDLIELRFRDPYIFQDRLRNLQAQETVTTQVAPAGDTTQRNSDGSVKRGYAVTEQADQKVSVTQLVPPKLCKRSAQIDDLLEISYIGTVLETGAIFDGSAVKINGQGIPGRGDDVSLYFVLGKQPFGQFPPGWDVGLVGMCVGERRRLVIPPVLAYGSTGVPKRGIPPNATLQYDITLVSLNGLSTPQ